jgi:hypothetical protein
MSNIHVWKIDENNNKTWSVEQKPYLGHKGILKIIINMI